MDLSWWPQLAGLFIIGWFIVALVKPESARVKALFPWVAIVVVVAGVVAWLTTPPSYGPGPGPAVECEVKFEC